MEDKEYENSYAIPANYTDSGKLLGMITPRNAIEAIVLVLAAGYLEYLLIPMQEMVRVIVMVVTLLPMGIFAIIGIDGDSLLQYLRHVFRFIKSRRKLHYQKIGGGYEQKGKN